MIFHPTVLGSLWGIWDKRQWIYSCFGCIERCHESDTAYVETDVHHEGFRLGVFHIFYRMDFKGVWFDLTNWWIGSWGASCAGNVACMLPCVCTYLLYMLTCMLTWLLTWLQTCALTNIQVKQKWTCMLTNMSVHLFCRVPYSSLFLILVYQPCLPTLFTILFSFFYYANLSQTGFLKDF